MKIRLDLVKPSPRPVRTSWDEDKMQELAQSIKEQGLIVPIKVRPADNGYYEVVYGHRRVEAMRRVPVAETDAIVEGVDDTDALIQALIENVQREDMTTMDKARALQVLTKITGWTQSEIAKRGIMGRNHIGRLLALFETPLEVQDLLEIGEDGPKAHSTTERVVREARRVLDDEHDLIGAVKKAARERLNPEQARKVAESIAATENPRSREFLLETPYSTFIHDPEYNRERFQEYGMHDPMHMKEPTKGVDWASTPEVKAIIYLIKEWQERVPEITKAVQQGKLAPEAQPFVLRRVVRLIATLRKLAIELGGQ